VFQDRSSESEVRVLGFADVLVVVFVAVIGEGLEVEEACLIEMELEHIAGFLKETWRFERGIRRGEEESGTRRGVGVPVWKELVVRSVGCNRQLIAAVRRVGAV